MPNTSEPKWRRHDLPSAQVGARTIMMSNNVPNVHEHKGGIEFTPEMHVIPLTAVGSTREVAGSKPAGGCPSDRDQKECCLRDQLLHGVPSTDVVTPFIAASCHHHRVTFGLRCGSKSQGMVHKGSRPHNLICIECLYYAYPLKV